MAVAIVLFIAAVIGYHESTNAELDEPLVSRSLAYSAPWQVVGKDPQSLGSSAFELVPGHQQVVIIGVGSNWVDVCVKATYGGILTQRVSPLVLAPIKP